jgi:hypothetical protein
MKYKCIETGMMSSNGDMDDFFAKFQSDSGDIVCLDYYNLMNLGWKESFQIIVGNYYNIQISPL